MDEDLLRDKCIRCGERRASVCPPSALCSRCIVETLGGTAVESVAKKRKQPFKGLLRKDE